MIRRPAALLLGAAVLALAALWTAADAPRERSTAAAVAPDGAALFLAKGCATCHDGPGSDSRFDAGPSLRDAPAWAATRVPGLSAEGYVAQSITDPVAAISPAPHAVGARMPTIAVSPAELDALVTHLLAG